MLQLGGLRLGGGLRGLGTAPPSLAAEVERLLGGRAWLGRKVPREEGGRRVGRLAVAEGGHGGEAGGHRGGHGLQGRHGRGGTLTGVGGAAAARGRRPLKHHGLRQRESW